MVDKDNQLFFSETHEPRKMGKNTVCIGLVKRWLDKMNQCTGEIDLIDNTDDIPMKTVSFFAVFFQQRTLCIVVNVSGRADCHDVRTDGEFGVAFAESLSEQHINSCNITIFDQTNQKFLAMCPQNDDVTGKCNFILDNHHTKFLACAKKHQLSREKKIPVFSIHDQPVSEHFTEEIELHCSQKHNDLLHTHVRDHGLSSRIARATLLSLNARLRFFTVDTHFGCRVIVKMGDRCWC